MALAEKGIDTVVISSASSFAESNTFYAQGGIIFEGESHDPDSLVEDVLEAGCRINYLPAVRQLAELDPFSSEKS